jgi:hypothetical protein
MGLLLCNAMAGAGGGGRTNGLLVALAALEPGSLHKLLLEQLE